ncbi:MAG TPA: hypothetical protein VK528_02510 [Flavobacterium sp.]|nr:hypothetical protein [Flavobacterium sp.]
METNPDHILLFSTNIGKVCTNCSIHKVLDAHPEIVQWNIDAEDVDCVLRVVSESMSNEEIIEIVNILGYDCRELK